MIDIRTNFNPNIILTSNCVSCLKDSGRLVMVHPDRSKVFKFTRFPIWSGTFVIMILLAINVSSLVHSNTTVGRPSTDGPPMGRRGSGHLINPSGIAVNWHL